MIKCGNCKGHHATVAAVKVCCGVTGATTVLVYGDGPAKGSSHAVTEPLQVHSIEDIEREMHRMEAEEDRAQSYREERDKQRFKAATETWSPADRERAQFDRGMRRLATAREIHECRELLETKEIHKDWQRWATAMKRLLASGEATEFAVRTAIQRLNGMRNVRAGGYKTPTPAPAGAPPAVPTAQASAPVRDGAAVKHEGLYRLSRDVWMASGELPKGTLVQVLRGKDSMKLYAKRVDGLAPGKRPVLTYVAGLIFKLLDAELLPADEAQEITRQTGWCVFGHFLTNPVSIARGMGPKCYERYPHLARNAA